MGFSKSDHFENLIVYTKEQKLIKCFIFIVDIQKNMIIKTDSKKHLKHLRFHLQVIGWEDSNLKFMLMDDKDNNFAVFLDYSESELKDILVDGVLNEESLFWELLLNLISFEIYTEKQHQEKDALEAVRDLLAHFSPDRNYMNYRDEIENALLHHVGNALGFKEGDHSTRTLRKNVTAERILEKIDFILHIHEMYICLNDSDEYRKMINKAIWRLLLYVTDILVISRVQKNYMASYFHTGQDVTRESLMECINKDLNYFDPEGIRAELRRLDISPSIKRYDFRNVIVPVENNIDHVLPKIGTIHLYQFQTIVSLTYRSYLINKGLTSSHEIINLQNECIKLFYSVIDNPRINSFDMLQGLYKINVTRDLMTEHIHFAVTIADEVLNSIESSATLAC